MATTPTIKPRPLSDKLSTNNSSFISTIMPLWKAAEILRLKPGLENHGFTCIGTTRLGTRCANRINKPDRAHTVVQLDCLSAVDITAPAVIKGEAFQAMLKGTAEQSLCVRWHRGGDSQINEVMKRWTKSVQGHARVLDDEYLEKQAYWKLSEELGGTEEGNDVEEDSKGKDVPSLPVTRETIKPPPAHHLHHSTPQSRAPFAQPFKRCPICLKTQPASRRSYSTLCESSRFQSPAFDQGKPSTETTNPAVPTLSGILAEISALIRRFF